MKLKGFTWFLIFLLMLPNLSIFVSANELSGDESDPEINWELVWNDEFDGDELDTTKWQYDTGNGFYAGDEWVPGWGNNESQNYQEDNVRLEDGKLILEAREETTTDEHGEYDYTSGKILTDELFSQAYGRFEASIKLPEGQGYWPAFWMMPQDDVYGGWAASGEIDIMENRGSETDKVGAAIHYGDLWPDNTYSAEEYHFPEGQSTANFNEYSIEWEPGEIRWYVNDELYTTKTEWGTKYGEYPAPFDQEFFMILNLAVGGWYGGEPDETTEFPGQMEVDYVRVYEDADAEHPPPGEWIDPGEGDEAPVDGSKDWQEVGDNLIEDGTFETTTEFGDQDNSIVWNIFNMADYDNSAGSADFSIENEELKASIQQVGWAWWNIQLMQDVTVPSGIYKIEFDMRSELDRKVSVELVDSESGIHDFEVGSTMETYEAYINVGADGEYSLMFGLGRGEDDPELDVPYDLFIDNVRLVEVVRGEINWELTWNDEFEGSELDTSKWRIDIGNGFYAGDEWVPGWGNNESQNYQEDNVRLEDGKLILEAREETTTDEHGEYDYTSGKILTDELFSQAYGRFEANIKLPDGQGYWPAFWMMPQDDVYGGWAASGEIDIMENRGSETDKVGAAIHYGDLWPNNTYSAEEYHFPEGQSTTDFNEYSIEWEPGEIRWYVNDELYSTKTEWGTKYGEYPAPFDQEFFMILNLAVGGWYGGEPDETTEFPGQMEVDYVRVYEDADAEHPPPGEWIDPGEGDEDGETPPVDGSKDWQEVGDNLIEDGTFETTTEFGDQDNSIVWNIFNMADYDNSAGSADFSIENEELKASIQQVGWAWWHIQLMQDVTVPSGIYKVAFDMRSEHDRNVSVELVDSESGINEFEVGSTMESYEAYINVGSDGDYKLMFGLGRGQSDPEVAVPYDLFIDNVKLVEVVEGEETLSLEGLYHAIEDLKEDGKIKKSASKQLTNSLDTAEKHYEDGKEKQAIKHLEKFISKVDGNQMRSASDEVKELLKISAEQLMKEWF